jgi:hypothetical protein
MACSSCGTRDRPLRHAIRAESEDFAKQVGLRVPEGAAITPEGLRWHREASVPAMRASNAAEVPPAHAVVDAGGAASRLARVGSRAVRAGLELEDHGKVIRRRGEEGWIGCPHPAAGDAPYQGRPHEEVVQADRRSA